MGISTFETGVVKPPILTKEGSPPLRGGGLPTLWNIKGEFPDPQAQRRLVRAEVQIAGCSTGCCLQQESWPSVPSQVTTWRPHPRILPLDQSMLQVLGPVVGDLYADATDKSPVSRSMSG